MLLGICYDQDTIKRKGSLKMAKYRINGYEAVYGMVEGIGANKLYVALGGGRHGELYYNRISVERDPEILGRFKIGDTLPCVILEEDFGYCKLSHRELLVKPDIDSFERGDELIVKAIDTYEGGTVAAITAGMTCRISGIWVSPGTPVLASVIFVDKLRERLVLLADSVLYDTEPPELVFEYGKVERLDTERDDERAG